MSAVTTTFRRHSLPLHIQETLIIEMCNKVSKKPFTGQLSKVTLYHNKNSNNYFFTFLKKTQSSLYKNDILAGKVW